MSPFQDVPTHGTTPGAPRQHPLKWIIVGLYSLVALLAVVLIAGLLWKRTVNNPYRTLEVFSTEKYFENPRALIGNRFQATLRVEGDLGWSAGVGKLMVFSTEGDNRYIPVLIAEDHLNYSFSKGQTYVAQVTVKEGGLLYATDLKKK